MISWIVFYFTLSDPIYQIELPNLTISGEGIITEQGIKSNGAYNSVISVRILNNISSVSNNAFQGIESIKEVRIESEYLTRIGTYSFSSMPSLEFLWFSDNMIEIGHSAMRASMALKCVRLGKKLKKIIGVAFYDCRHIVDVELPNSLEFIGDNAFTNCFNLRKVTFGNSIKTIQNGAFMNTNISKVFLQSSLETFSSGIFSGCKYLVFIEVDESSNLFSNDNQGILYNKNKSILYQCPSGLVEVQIPTSVNEILTQGFSYCPKLIRLEIPASVNILHQNSVIGCPSLINLSIDSNDIPSKTFGSIEKLSFIRFGDNVESIRSNCFTYSPNVKDISFGKKVSIIEQEIFSTSVKLERITVSNESKTLLLENGVLYVLNNSEPISIALILKNATAVKIGAKIKEVSIKGINVPTLKSITVDPNNECYSSESNTLYNKDFSVLYLIAALSDNLNVNSQTKNISDSAAKGCRIRHISLNEGLEYILNEAF